MAKNQAVMRFQLENIGPLGSLSFESSQKIGYSFFAANGQGKTFISRCFAALQNDNYPYVDNLTSFGKYNSSFNVDIEGVISKFEIKNGHIVRERNIDRIFYVFNSDYVNDNVEKKGYQPDNTISGIILGKNQIDLTKEREELKKLEANFKQKGDLIRSEIEKSKSNLELVKVSKLLKEYKEITFDSLLQAPLEDKHKYDETYENVKKLSNMPDDLSDIRTLSSVEDTIDYDELEKLLVEKVSPSNYEKEFIDYVKNNSSFIETGLNIYKENKLVCPYCKRSFDDKSLNIIHQYSNYLEDKEMYVTKRLSYYYKTYEGYETAVHNVKKQVIDCKIDEKLISNYVPELEELSYEALDKSIVEVLSSITKIKNSIKEKLCQLSSLSIDLSLSNYRDSIVNFNKTVDVLNEEIDKVNKRKNSVQAILKNNKKELCVELLKKIRIDNHSLISDYMNYGKIVESKKKEISVKELTNNVDKKKLISDTISELLESFFHGKYIFDKENFEIKLKKTHVVKNGRFTLSDGEKSVIAFIYYVASVFEIVKTEDDYDKVIFVIDDPISSMDFSYVYETASIIKNLKQVLGINFDKKIILTHNFEFFNILKRNRVSKDSFILNNGTIEKMTKDMLLPYECHLDDIYYISIGEKNPTHTTPNSIRHVLETICGFENNDRSSTILESFIKEKDEFKGNDYIYSLMQDLSHGAYRLDSPYIDSELKMACEKVIEYIGNHYPGQLDCLKKS